jgi:hypothetical protein
MSFKGYGANWILSSLKDASAEELVSDNPRKELLDYINSPREVAQDGEQDLDPVKWWGVCILLLVRSTFTNLHLSIIQSSILSCHSLHVIIWQFKALLWPQKDPFQVVASQILYTETVWIHFYLEECRSSNMPINLTLLMLMLMLMLIKQ